MIRDEVVVVEILEQAGQQLANNELQRGAAQSPHGLAWVTLRNVAISKLRRAPYLLEKSLAGSTESALALARLAARDGSAKGIEDSIFLGEVLGQMSERERKIAIWKKNGLASRWIAEELEMSVSSVDTTYARLRQRLQKLLGKGYGACR
jgi:DNA-directed RNA polymerase specialized sigma24 family protein